MRVLIVDEGRERSSVAAARALSSAGWTVGAASMRPNLASRSRATAAWHEIAHTDDGDEAFAASVEAVVRQHGYEVVFVTWDRAVAAVSERRGRLSFAVGYGRHEGVLLAMDKERLVPVAQEAGIRSPPGVAASVDGISAAGGPVIVKSASPVTCGILTRSFADPAEALRYTEEIRRRGGTPLVQEHLAGTLMAVSLVAGASGIVTIAQQVAEKTWPHPDGVTARGLSVHVEDGLRQAIERLLERLEWQGLAQLQFIVPADGEPRLIDFNTRFYGSLPLAIRAGANHPDAWARTATGRAVGVSVGRPGVRYQWLSRDLRASWASPQRARELRTCVRVGATAAHNLWSWREPLLAPGFLAAQAARAAERRLQRTDRDGGARAGAALPRTDRDGSARASAALHHAPPSADVLTALRDRPIHPAPVRIAQRVLMKAGRLSYEDRWLRPLQRARRKALGPAGAGPPRLLVRVDEFPYYSGLDNPKYGREASRRFHAVMAEHGVRHLMSVVPQWTHEPLRPDGSGGRRLDEHDLELLEQMRADGVSFGQHGATHRTRFTDPRRQSELCGLDARELAALLDRGRADLDAAGIATRILVPPFNRFDASQWPVLAERYDVITGGPESVVLMGFHGGPQWRGSAIYLPCYAPLYDTADRVLPAVERLVGEEIGTWIPIVLHMGWEIDEGLSALRRLARRIGPYAASWDKFLDDVDASRRP